MIELVLIDKSDEHIIEGLKILQDLTEKTETIEKVEELKNLVIEKDIGKRLLELQLFKNSQVYDRAIDLLERINLE